MDFILSILMMFIICGVSAGDADNETFSLQTKIFEKYLKSPITISIGVFIFAVVIIIVAIDCKTRCELKHLKLINKQKRTEIATEC